MRFEAGVFFKGMRYCKMRDSESINNCARSRYGVSCFKVASSSFERLSRTARAASFSCGHISVAAANQPQTLNALLILLSKGRKHLPTQSLP